ncbi:unnamed protein product [Ostreobium quekettii]|uniref:Tr-type G domain-containing protein n=1 Tax=Ostreobium quekettii TaxID=121088 RepID=A0A8S1J6E0_9CHLO|nr:unnamed protein product [Ostreobium quekettii]|eukprot:evm.model.scf_724.4 EVM.evm.TU.scf_724.4   scf_724:32189-38048(-)
MMHHKRVHHLSEASGEEAGWVEGITGLTEESPATGLLTMDDVSRKDRASALAARSAVVNGLASLGLSEDFQTRLEHAIEVMYSELEYVGESSLEVGTPGPWGFAMTDPGNLEVALEQLGKAAAERQADLTILRKRTLDVPAEQEDEGTVPCHVADVLVRCRAGTRAPSEVRVAIIGNVDSGKSTMVGVLTRHILDDGRGLARSRVFKHTHEEATGRTSSIGQHNLVLDSKGVILNDPMFKNTNCADYVARASKVLTLVDLAGHERYFKTTAYGLTGHLPDYGCVIIGANAGVIGMCKEHLGVALALKVPVFFVVTKVDICPEHILKNTMQSLTTILRKPGVKKKPIIVRSEADVLLCAKNIMADSLAPIFLTSAVTGEGLDLVRMFFNLLPQRQHWADKWNDAVEFIIDETFGVPGVGTVVAGTVKRGIIGVNSTLLLGPDIGDASFKPTAIKSIHYKRLTVSQVVAGQTAALALKKVKRGQVRKGMVLVGMQLKPKATWEFDADIAILTHSTTIQPRYQAVIHCEIVKQSAKVVAMDRERLRSGDRAVVRFRFLQRPEYLTPGSRFVFREGRTKGIGVIIGVEGDQ